MMWMEIPNCFEQRKGDNPNRIPYLPFLLSVQKESQMSPNAVVMIECKNEYDAERPASAYELAYHLGIPTALTISIEGRGILPFLHALFIAHFHLSTKATSVIIVASPVSKVPAESSRENVPKGQIINGCLAVRLLMQQPEGQDSLHAKITQVSPKSFNHNMSDVLNAKDLNLQTVPVTANSAWLLNQRNASQHGLELFSSPPQVSMKWKSTCCDSCHDLLEKISKTYNSAKTLKKGILLAGHQLTE
jgi:hypothetical protein